MDVRSLRAIIEQDMEPLLSDKDSEASSTLAEADAARTSPQDVASVSDEARTTGDGDHSTEVEDGPVGRVDSSDTDEEANQNLEDTIEEHGNPEGEPRATLSADVVAVPGAVGGAAATTEVNSELAERRARAALLRAVRGHVRHTSGASHVVAASDTAHDVSEPYEWTIEDVRSFLAFRTNQRERTHLLSTPRYYYGYRVVADVVISPTFPFEIKLKAYALKGDFDEQLAWPLNKTPTLWFVHPSGDLSRDIRLRETTTPWGRISEDSSSSSNAPREALYKWSSVTFTSIAELRKRGFTANGKLRFRFNLERMHDRA